MFARVGQETCNVGGLGTPDDEFLKPGVISMDFALTCREYRLASQASHRNKPMRT
jgi:hypothetical protein